MVLANPTYFVLTHLSLHSLPFLALRFALHFHNKFPLSRIYHCTTLPFLALLECPALSCSYCTALALPILALLECLASPIEERGRKAVRLAFCKQRSPSVRSTCRINCLRESRQTAAVPCVCACVHASVRVTCLTCVLLIFFAIACLFCRPPPQKQRLIVSC